MSASSKKKLRSAEQAEKLTERQLQEQKEAKKLKILTIVIVALVALMLVFAIYTAVSRTITNSGMKEKNTVALTVGDREISSAELNYFYMYAINNFNNTYGSMASLVGLDTTLPLNEQFFNEETNTTWADYFLESASASAQAVYAIQAAADADGYTLPESYAAQIDSAMTNFEAYAVMYGYPDTTAYARAVYGNGASEKGLREYLELTAMADAYQNHYAESVTIEEADLQAENDADPKQYNAYSYNSYYLAASRFLTGGTTDEEKAASVAAAEAAAKGLAAGEYADVAAFDAAIAALPVNAEATTAASTAYDDVLYTKLNSVVKDWVSDSARQAGEMGIVPSTSTTTAEDGTETTTTNGYYIVMYHGTADNNYPLVNVRHILVAFEGGSYDSSTGMTTYSDEEKAAAKKAAEELLAQWEAGNATEDSFAALANEHSDDGDGTTGGLYEDVFPGQMVINFNDWCFDESRKAGDTGIVESTYGYHVMFYSGDSETSYRNYLIDTKLRSAAVNEWYTALIESAAMTEGNTKYLPLDLVLSAA